MNRTAMRIVSLAPAVTETVCALGCGDRIVGRTSYCEFSEVASVAVVGGFGTVDKEDVLALEPDLVIGTTLHRPVLAAVESTGCRVVMLVPRLPQHAPAVIRSVGHALGIAEEAGRFADTLAEKLAELQGRALRRKRRRVCYLCDIGCPAWRSCIVPQALPFLNCILVGRDGCGEEPVESRVKAVVGGDPEVLVIPGNHLEEAMELIDTDRRCAEWYARRHPAIVSVDPHLLGRVGPSSAAAFENLYDALFNREEYDDEQ